ncbi:DUF1510 family protein [Radiobacillus kanasensis]|uniref:YrrS family protein n=1 Tax=Radiobacillus kanasensis TaxID=2844358 RepID=UPI001E2C0EC2|nr:YrrS family protein [Radiobacillus kanasensis]UFT97859.1 DUF1510 family protein [Radiobacillus kanasensis]
MSDEYNAYTRADKFEKRRKNTKAITFLLSIGGILVIVLIGFIFFGGDDEKTAQDTEEPTTESNQTESEESASESADTESTESMDVTEEEDTDASSTGDTESSSDENNENIQVEEVSSNDDNVIKAYRGDWEPIGTQQEGEHVITFEQGTQDWKEMMDAVSLATGLNRNDMIQWWVSRAGDQSIEATVSNPSETEIYRVSVNWVDQQGWQPTLVEQLKENDQKHRFEEDSSTTEQQDSEQTEQTE